MSYEAINFRKKLALFDEQWKPKVIAEMNDYQFKVVPIVSAGGCRVGDYTNPILKPQAAEVVKKHAEIELNAGPAPNPINQCRPSGVPFVFYNMVDAMI